MIDDKYTYPDSGGVLVNHFGLRDAGALDHALNAIASAEWASMLAEGLPPEFTFDTLGEIHRHLFSEILPFAGELRDVDAQAVGAGIVYCRPDFISPALNGAFAKLHRRDCLVDLDADAFAAGLADHWGELSAIHPFRDGNTRSQCVYVSALAVAAGHPIRWQIVDVDQLRAQRLAAVSGDEGPLTDYIRSVLGSTD